MVTSEFSLNLQIEAALRKVINVCTDGLKDMAENTVSIAKTDHPYKNQTGTNTSEITWDENDGAVRVYTQSGYGGYLELGTSKMQPYPYIMPAYEQSKKELKNELEGSI